MTPVRLSKQSANPGSTFPNFLIDDLSSQTFDDQKHSGWPFVECVVSVSSIYYFMSWNILFLWKRR